MRLVFSLVLVFLFTSCDNCISTASPVFDRIAFEVAAKYNLECGGHTGHYGHEEVERVDLMFRKDAGVSLDEARRLIVNIHKDAFCQIKNEKTISPFIDSIFFDRDSLVIYLVFKHRKDNTRYLSPYVGGIAIEKGVVQVIFYDDETGNVIKHEESLEEAYRIVEGELALSEPVTLRAG